MHKAKEIITHGKHVLKGIVYLGFGIQIILGVIWMCSNFAHAQHFAPSRLGIYQWMLECFGRVPQWVYLLQLVIAFLARYLFVRKVVLLKKWQAVFVTCALMTFPFSMQCHMSLQPYSLLNSVFYVVLYFSCTIFGRGKETVRRAILLFITLVLFIVFASGVERSRNTSVSGHGWEAHLASRMAWPTLWIDMEPWSEELREMAPSGLVWEAAFSPDNMGILIDRIELKAGREKAKDYYMEMAKTAWGRRYPSIVRQLAWDALGYTVTPLIFPLQMQGVAYDSYSGTNYGVMMEHTPRMTVLYVTYGCWWFACMFALVALSGCVRLTGHIKSRRLAFTKEEKRALLPLTICAIYLFLLVMRGSGMMDYRLSAGVNELWLLLAFLVVENQSVEEEPADVKEER